MFFNSRHFTYKSQTTIKHPPAGGENANAQAAAVACAAGLPSPRMFAKLIKVH
jgi:hypothetical protein